MKNTKLYTTALVASVLSVISASAAASTYEVSVTNLTYGMHFTPLILATHSPSAQMFSAGVAASPQLQAIAEGGDTSSMAALLDSVDATVITGDGLLAPGGTATFMINDSEGDVFSMAGMLLPTNDGFAGVNSASLPSGSAGTSVSINVLGYDAGTEANDEVVGSGAPGEAGFPAPPPVVATGTGTGAVGVPTQAEGFVHIHRNVLGDLDANGGISDINATVHRWLNPVARITITKMGGDNGESGVTSVIGLNAQTYSKSALEVFWQAATSAESYVTGYEIRRDGALVDTRDGTSFFDDNLQAGTEYTYEIRAMDAAGNIGGPSSVSVRTNP